MVFSQLFIIGLSIAPAALDCYLQAKFKQFLVTPLCNFCYTVLVSFLNTVLHFVLGVVTFLVTPFTLVLHRIYTDTIYILSCLLYILLYIIWLVGTLTQFIYSLLVCLYASVVQHLVSFYTSQQAALYYVHSMLSNLLTSFITALISIVTDALGFIWAILQVLWAVVVPLAKAIFFVMTNIHLIMLFVFKFTVAAVVVGIACHLGVLIYRFFNHRDFALQGDFYFGPNPQNPHQ